MELLTPLIGEYNYANICAAAAMARLLGIDDGAIQEAVKTFKGVKRRQELIHEGPGVKIYEDFAHHPTAIAYFIGSMSQRFPGAKIFAIYEPRSATSRRSVFQESLPASFAQADGVFIKRPYRLEGIREGERIDIDAVIEGIKKLGRPANLYGDVADIVRDVVLSMDPAGANIILIMSNGGFDGIYAKMIDAVKTRTPN
jgi:UDP-N-acetylmuramate: L-alanyl-gamma-D-glutamyl-meso-diaminopimelate ligase